MKKILKDSLALFLITLVAGILLGLVYKITKEPIKEQEEKINKNLKEKEHLLPKHFVKEIRFDMKFVVEKGMNIYNFLGNNSDI